MFRKLFLALVFLGSTISSAYAATDIQWWHAHAGRLGEVVNLITEKFNASQSDYNLVATYKGGYEDTMTASIAAFRAKTQPHLIQIFDAGAATIINAKGATYPVADLMVKYGKGFNINDYIAGVRYFYADSDGKMIGMPFNSSTPLLYYNKECVQESRYKRSAVDLGRIRADRTEAQICRLYRARAEPQPVDFLGEFSQPPQYPVGHRQQRV